MESEKVKEIKKGLECCSNPICEGNNKCPYHNKECMSELSQDALIRINELEEENTFLRDMITKFRQENTTLYDDIYKKVVKDIGTENQQFKNRIAELEKENKDYKDRCELIHDLGFDYDGSKTIEDFKILVDELVLVAINGAQVKKVE